MSGRWRSCLALLVVGFAAAPARAQTPAITSDDFRPIAEVAGAASLQAPADVNQRPVCERLALPCLTPRTFGDLGLVVAAAVYPGDAIGVVGKVSAYADGWSAYDAACDRRSSTCTLDRTNHVVAALVGLRVRTPLLTRWSSRGRLFAQALAGPQWSEVGPLREVLQPGGGYEWYLGNGVVTIGIAVPLGAR